MVWSPLVVVLLVLRWVMLAETVRRVEHTAVGGQGALAWAVNVRQPVWVAEVTAVVEKDRPRFSRRRRRRGGVGVER